MPLPIEFIFLYTRIPVGSISTYIILSLSKMALKETGCRTIRVYYSNLDFLYVPAPEIEAAIGLYWCPWKQIALENSCIWSVGSKLITIATIYFWQRMVTMLV
jgi:hypothetical protein